MRRAWKEAGRLFAKGGNGEAAAPLPSRAATFQIRILDALDFPIPGYLMQFLIEFSENENENLIAICVDFPRASISDSGGCPPGGGFPRWAPPRTVSK